MVAAHNSSWDLNDHGPYPVRCEKEFAGEKRGRKTPYRCRRMERWRGDTDAQQIYLDWEHTGDGF